MPSSPSRPAFWILTLISGALAVLWFPWPPPMLGMVLALVPLAIAIGTGLALGRSYGLGAPYLEAWEAGERKKRPGGLALVLAPFGGLLVGGILLLAIRFLTFLPGVDRIAGRFAAGVQLPLWERWAVVSYSGLSEEILFRLLTVSLMVWILRRPLLPSSRWPLARCVWIGIVVGALSFGAAHLPKWSAEIAHLPAFALTILLLNGAAGLLFGYLFWRRGLEVAILCHFGADVAVYILGPALFRSGAG